jgi:hypothetical protein
MAKYAIAGISFFNNEMKMEVVETTDELGALAIAYKNIFGVDMPSDLDLSPEELKAAAFDMDGMIGAICIDNPPQVPDMLG